MDAHSHYMRSNKASIRFDRHAYTHTLGHFRQASGQSGRSNSSRSIRSNISDHIKNRVKSVRGLVNKFEVLGNDSSREGNAVTVVRESSESRRKCGKKNPRNSLQTDIANSTLFRRRSSTFQNSVLGSRCAKGTSEKVHPPLSYWNLSGSTPRDKAQLLRVTQRKASTSNFSHEVGPVFRDSAFTRKDVDPASISKIMARRRPSMSRQQSNTAPNLIDRSILMFHRSRFNDKGIADQSLKVTVDTHASEKKAPVLCRSSPTLRGGNAQTHTFAGINHGASPAVNKRQINSPSFENKTTQLFVSEKLNRFTRQENDSVYKLRTTRRLGPGDVSESVSLSCKSSVKSQRGLGPVSSTKSIDNKTLASSEKEGSSISQYDGSCGKAPIFQHKTVLATSFLNSSKSESKTRVSSNIGVKTLKGISGLAERSYAGGENLMAFIPATRSVRQNKNPVCTVMGDVAISDTSNDYYFNQGRQEGIVKKRASMFAMLESANASKSLSPSVSKKLLHKAKTQADLKSQPFVHMSSVHWSEGLNHAGGVKIWSESTVSLAKYPEIVAHDCQGHISDSSPTVSPSTNIVNKRIRPIALPKTLFSPQQPKITSPKLTLNNASYKVLPSRPCKASTTMTDPYCTSSGVSLCTTKFEEPSDTGGPLLHRLITTDNEARRSSHEEPKSGKSIVEKKQRRNSIFRGMKALIYNLSGEAHRADAGICHSPEQVQESLLRATSEDYGTYRGLIYKKTPDARTVEEEGNRKIGPLCVAHVEENTSERLIPLTVNEKTKECGQYGTTISIEGDRRKSRTKHRYSSPEDVPAPLRSGKSTRGEVFEALPQLKNDSIDLGPVEITLGTIAANFRRSLYTVEIESALAKCRTTDAQEIGSAFSSYSSKDGIPCGKLTSGEVEPGKMSSSAMHLTTDVSKEDLMWQQPNQLLWPETTIYKPGIEGTERVTHNRTGCRIASTNLSLIRRNKQVWPSRQQAIQDSSQSPDTGYAGVMKNASHVPSNSPLVKVKQDGDRSADRKRKDYKDYGTQTFSFRAGSLVNGDCQLPIGTSPKSRMMLWNSESFSTVLEHSAICVRDTPEDSIEDVSTIQTRPSLRNDLPQLGSRKALGGNHHHFGMSPEHTANVKIITNSESGYFDDSSYEALSIHGVIDAGPSPRDNGGIGTLSTQIDKQELVEGLPFSYLKTPEIDSIKHYNPRGTLEIAGVNPLRYQKASVARTPTDMLLILLAEHVAGEEAAMGMAENYKQMRVELPVFGHPPLEVCNPKPKSMRQQRQILGLIRKFSKESNVNHPNLLCPPRKILNY
jgi:hypothetical protein